MLRVLLSSGGRGGSMPEHEPTSTSLTWHSVTSKGEVVSLASEHQFCMDFPPVYFSPHDFVYTCLWQKTSCAAVVPTPIVFSMKWHPSKLMGCNHHHKYTVTRPTARSWVFNSQSMGCKEWQAWGTQFAISLTAPSWELGKNPESLPFFRVWFCLLNIFGDCRGETSIRWACDIQSILLTLCLGHPSTLSSCEIILIKVCQSPQADLLCGR